MLPVALDSEGIIPFKKFMQLNKLLHPPIRAQFLSHRRELYRKKNWATYDEIMKVNFYRSIELAAQAIKCMNKVTGLVNTDLTRSMTTYCADLDKRDIIEDMMENNNVPKDQHKRPLLSKEKTIMAIKQLNEQQAKCYKEAVKQAKAKDAENPDAEQEMQLKV